MRQPGNRLAFAAARAVLDQIIMTGAIFFGVSNQLAHGIALVIAGKDQLFAAVVGVNFYKEKAGN